MSLGNWSLLVFRLHSCIVHSPAIHQHGIHRPVPSRVDICYQSGKNKSGQHWIARHGNCKSKKKYGKLWNHTFGKLESSGIVFFPKRSLLFPLNHWNRTPPSLRHLDHKCTAKQKDIADRRPQRKLYRNPGRFTTGWSYFNSNPHKKKKMSWSSYEYEFQWHGGDSLVPIPWNKDVVL